MDTQALSVDEFAARREKRQNLIDQGINPYPVHFKKKLSLAQIREKYSTLEAEKESPEILVTAGRLVTKRGHGKASFGHLQDESGQLQIYTKLDNVGDDLYNLYRVLDMGDIIGVSGVAFITHTGELTLRVQHFTLLSKALNPLPEKFHGLSDRELRYRKRYVDLIANPDVMEVFRKRSAIISFIRRFLEDRGFMEVETPVLHTMAGGAAAKPFITHHNALDMRQYLRIALELHLKRLIVGGFEKVFEIGRVFRNEGISYKHNPEYTLLELYQAYADVNDMMELMETLLSSAAKAITGNTVVKYGDVTLDFTPPFKRWPMSEAIHKYSGIDIEGKDFAAIVAAMKETKIPVDPMHTSRGQLIMYLYDEYVEDHLIQPTFIIDYPIETSPLAKKHRSKEGLVERFELIVNTLEISNAFTELNDPVDQHERFVDQLKQKEAGDEEAHGMDTDFVEALEQGMPPTGGLGIGIDRVVMLLTNSQSIRDVLLFPHLKQK